MKKLCIFLLNNKMNELFNSCVSYFFLRIVQKIRIFLHFPGAGEVWYHCVRANVFLHTRHFIQPGQPDQSVPSPGKFTTLYPLLILQKFKSSSTNFRIYLILNNFKFLSSIFRYYRIFSNFKFSVNSDSLHFQITNNFKIQNFKSSTTNSGVSKSPLFQFLD